MNQKGQSFDVFQLLIAAVVAIAIMGILFGVLGQVITTPGGDIGSDIRTMIKKGANDGYASPQNNLKVTIAAGTTITPANVVKDTDITADQLCISTGDFGTDALFDAKETGAITYTGSSSRKIGISVLCGRGPDRRLSRGQI